MASKWRKVYVVATCASVARHFARVGASHTSKREAHARLAEIRRMTPHGNARQVYTVKLPAEK